MHRKGSVKRSSTTKEKKVVAENVVTNRKFAENDTIFNSSCSEAGVNPTKRQASKFRLGKGIAFKTMRTKREIK